jgi:hypothetical protein
MTKSLRNSNKAEITAQNRVSNTRRGEKPGLGTLSAQAFLAKQNTAAKVAGGIVPVKSQSATRREKFIQDAQFTRQWYIDHGYIKPVVEEVK